MSDWWMHQEEPPSDYEIAMRNGFKSERERVIEIDFGRFSDDGEVLHCDHSDLPVGTVISNHTLTDSQGELYVVTRVGKSTTIIPEDPTHWQEYGVTRITERELMLIRCGFENGWGMCEFCDSHLSRDEAEAAWEENTRARNI